ncbi:MAG: COQ9 family protein [Alphaproteobacteria bacterium]|jgi:ubiquinone biosynthesis protein COQ9|nr:COQ9 family protein [Alphaproteobacteria bacterium]MDP6812629.1 COQ9 family protein [Alphaproteobacteria bacterium]
MSAQADDQRRAILRGALPAVPFDGWTDRMLRQAATEAGLDGAALRRLLPGGPAQLVAFFMAEADRWMAAEAEKRDLAALRLRERIAQVVRIRLEVLAPHREAVRRAVTLQLLPGWTGPMLRRLAATVDAMWRLAGDRSVDFSYYSKRAMLAAIYAATLVRWLDDQSDDCAETWAFLERRIDDVMAIGKARRRAEKLAERLPSPMRLLTRLRYGRRRAA